MKDLFTPEEQKIRKRWLITLFWMLPFELFMLGCASMEQSKPLEFFMFTLIFHLGITGLLYYFTYKKNGYRLLFWALLYPCYGIIDKLFKPEPWIQIDTVTDAVVLIAIIGINGWWYYVSLKLTDLHMKLRPSRKCKQAISQMKTAQTIEDLDLKFQDLMNQFPKYERPILKEYQEKKNSFECAP
jgi:hypothetical protein